MKRYFQVKTMKMGLILILFILSLPFSSTVFAASEEEIETLRMFYKEEDIAVVSATRFPKLKSQTAENITVITAKEIEEMNAHTLGDVLLNVTGVTIAGYPGLGGWADVHIQSADFTHTLLLIDGVRMTNLSDNGNEPSAFPVQNIERIEIIKGPASSAWGSSLGGVINVITKDPSVRKISGAISASQGESNTGDFRAEASGRLNDFSYYLYGGILKSNGVVPGYRLNENNFYTKLNYNLTEQISLMFTTGYIKEDKGLGEFLQWDETDKTKAEYLFSTLSMDYSINRDAELKVSLRTSKQNHEFNYITMSTGDIFYHSFINEKDYGGNALFSLKQGIHNIVAGAEFDNASVTTDFWTVPKQNINKHAVFANDTIPFGNLTITPGVRYDYTTKAGSIFSPSLGATYRLSNRTLLRFTLAQGFNTPSVGALIGGTPDFRPNPNLTYEKIFSMQAGIETTAIKYLYLKTGLFSCRVRDSLNQIYFDDNTWSIVNEKRQKREGFEIEAKTVPVYNTSLMAGAFLVNTKDLDTGERVMDTVRTAYNIGMRYDDNKSVLALLKGNYTKWYTEERRQPQSSFIWDFNISKKVYTKDKQQIDLFASVHNIFNASQYRYNIYPNAKRWLEAGVRYEF